MKQKRLSTGGVASGLVLALISIASPVVAQAGAGAPALTPQEAEAQEMGPTLASFCNPARHRGMGASESVIDRRPDQLVGTASFLRSAEGTFLVFEQYDQALAGHCLVLGWFGGDLAPGPYAIKRLAMSSLEAEVRGQDRSFYATAAVRTPDESSVFVTESGTLEITSMQSGRVTGTFDLSGFVLESGVRTDGVAWEGSFTALEEG